MKHLRLFFAAIAAISLLAFASCSGNGKLKEIVNSINKECPASMGELGVMASAELDGNNVTIKMMVNEQYVNIEALQNNPGTMKANIRSMFTTPTEDMKALIEALQQANGGITFVYVGETSGKKVSVSLSSEEMQTMGQEGDEDLDAAIDAQIAISNAQTPIQVDEMTTLTQILREGVNIVYLYDIDEAQVSMADIETLREGMEALLLDSLRDKSNGSRYFIETCHKADPGCLFIYRYRGSTSGQTVEIAIPVARAFEN